jgi:hypothetical protein
MKTPILKITLSIVFAFCLSFFMSCEKDNPGGGGGNGGGDGGGGNQNNCSVYGTFTEIECGVGVYGSYWIMMDDGTFLQPCETDVVTLCALPITEGTRVKFGYKKITGPSSCDQMITCMAIDPRLADGTAKVKKVRITCIEIVDLQQPGDCRHEGTVRYHEDCKVKYLETDNMEQYEPVNQSVFNGLSVGERVKFSFKPVFTFQATCSGAAPVEVDCITSLNTNPGVCVPIVIGDDVKIPTEPNGAIQVESARIEGNCLKIKVGFGGCDGNEARIALTWDGIMGGLQPSVNLVLVDTQPQMCNAYFMKELSFDLSAIREREQGTVYIHIAGWDQPLSY